MPQFNGQFFGRPTVATFIDDSRLVGQNDATGITVGIIGTALGGQPQTALSFTSARDARKVLRGGELLDAVERAYGPGVNTAGAYRIIATRINAALPSTLTLSNITPAAVITLTSVDWGIHANQISVTIANGTTTGKKITVQKSGNAFIAPSLVVQDNISRSAIKVLYTGAGSAATMTITPTGATPTITSSCTGAVGDNLNLDLTQLLTMQQVVDAINAKGNYTASVAGPDPNASSITMDVLTAQDIKTAAYTAKADLQAQLDFFNSLTDLVSAVKAGSTAALPAANLVQTFMTGGSEGAAVTSTEWQGGFDVMQTQDVQIVVPVTGDALIHAMANTHCQSMASPQYKRERIAIVGGVAGETVTQVKNRAVALNSDRVQLVWPGLIDTDTTGSGVIVTVPPYQVAAQKAGLTAALGVPKSATNKFIGARGVETIVTPSQIDDLVATGVCVVELVPNKGYRLVQDVTSWQTDTRFTRRELSTRMALDYVAAQLRLALEPLIGEVNGPNLQARVIGNLTSTLGNLTSAGVLVGGDNVPSWTNLTVGVSGDQVIVSVQVAIAVPANFFAVTIFPTVFSSPLPAAR